MDLIEQAAQIARAYSYDDIVAAMMNAAKDYLSNPDVPNRLNLYIMCAAHQYSFSTLNGTPIEDIIAMVEKAAKSLEK